MASSLSLSIPLSSSSLSRSEPAPRTLRFCGLRKEALGFRPLNSTGSARIRPSGARVHLRKSISAVASNDGSTAKGKFDYDIVIIGAGVGGHGAALHAVEKGLKTAIIEGDVIGGTCVNRGCVPSKALLAVSGRMRELQSEHHMKALGLQVASAGYDRQGVADHANNLASKIRGNLTNSLKSLGVDILTGAGAIVSVGGVGTLVPISH